MKHWIVAILIALGITGAAADTDQEPFELGEVVVSASRTLMKIRLIGSSVSVITSEELERRGEKNVMEVLRNEPGIHITTSGGVGTTSSIRIRGAEDRHTLVLLDGVRIHSNTLGTGQLQNFSIDNIDRIEIVRGPQSTLYGSDAIGGVIQIFTKKGTQNQSAISYEGGFNHSNQISASTMGVTENSSFALGGSWLENDGYSTFPEQRGGVEDDGYRNQNVSASYHRNGWLDFAMNLRYSDGEHDIDGTGVDDPARFTRTRDAVGSIDFSKQMGKRWFHQATLSGFQDETEGNRTDFRIISVTKAAKWLSEFRFNEGNRIIGGFESEKQTGENIVGTGRFAKSTITNSGFLEGVFSYHDNVHFTLGGRHDNHSEFGDALTWRATTAYTGMRRTRFFGSYGTGFKAPTFNQLFSTSGNPNLKAEESRGWDAGVERTFGDRAILRATYFENRVDNLIEFAAPTFLAVQTARAKSNGVEVSGKLNIHPRLTFDANYTFVDARDEVSTLRLQRRPEDVYAAHLAWNPIDALNLDAYYRYAGPSYSATSERNRVEGYQVVAAVIAYKYRDRHKIWARGENILDEEYEESFRFNTQPSSYYGGYEYKF